MNALSRSRRISLLLLLLLAACQAQSVATTVAPVTTATRLARDIETTIVAILPTPSATAASPTKEPEIPAGQLAYTHLKALSEGIGPRVAGTTEEAKAAQYIVMEFERLGYVSEMRPFSITVKGQKINSANVIAVKPGKSSWEIIVGAHYDSVNAGKGADDNASAVAVILEAAKRIQSQNTPYTIRFILFGAEELEMQGSDAYVRQMTKDEIKNTIAMINLDSLIAGDKAYVYGDGGKKGVIRDWALDFAQNHHLALQTQPGENLQYPAGTTGDWSDHAPFKSAGIPYAYFESTNWALGDKDGYTQVSTEYGEAGEIWHTKYDTLEYIDATFPGRIQERLNLFVTVLEAILTNFEVAK